MDGRGFAQQPGRSQKNPARIERNGEMEISMLWYEKDDDDGIVFASFCLLLPTKYYLKKVSKNKDTRSQSYVYGVWSKYSLSEMVSCCILRVRTSSRHPS